MITGRWLYLNEIPIRPPMNHSSGNWEKIERAKDKQPSVGVSRIGYRVGNQRLPAS